MLHNSFTLVCFTLLAFCSSCSVTKDLTGSDYLLYSQRIKDNKQVQTEELSPFFRQKLNSRFLGLPVYRRVWLYKRGLKSYNPDSIKIKIQRKETYFENEKDKIRQKLTNPEATGADSVSTAKTIRKLENRKTRSVGRLQKGLEKGNWLMRNGELPTLLDTALAAATSRQMQLFLREKKGFFQAKVRYEVKYDSVGRTANITYLITENNPYFFNKITYDTTGNAHIDSLLFNTRGDSPLKENENYDKDKLDNERERLNKLFRNDGYFFFNREFITFSVDTTVADSLQKNGLADIQVIVNAPSETETHQRYKISEVLFISEAGTRGKRDTVRYKDIKYLVLPDAISRKRYSKTVLNSKLTIRPGDYFNQDNKDETQRRLGSMDVFKFANIINDTIANHLRTSIFTSPLERYQTSEEVGGTVSQGLPGPVISWTFKVRNMFRGLGIFEVTARASIEGQTGFVKTDKPFSSQELSINPSLTFPKIFIPTPIRFKFDPYNPRTRIFLAYSYTNRPEYNRRNIRAGMIYSWQTSPKRAYSVSLIDMNYVNTTRIDKDFQDYLDQQSLSNGQLANSFKNGFVSGVNASYTYNDFSPNLNTVSRYWKFYVETGGAFVNLLTPLLSNDDNILGIQFYRYYRMSIDFRHYRPVTKHSQLVFRINTGFANTYGNTQSLPYEKFFFAGGSNSVRAWFPRRLGLGSAQPIPPTKLDSSEGRTTVDDVRYRYEQQGNILLELNAEYRFKVFKYLNMAIFSDAGNLWTLKPLEKRPNTNFSFDRFYKELAWGGGIGVRLDFSFLIIRADLATKFYEPYRTDDSGDKRWRVSNITWQNLNPFARWQRTEQQTLLNLGIGYPF